MARTKEEFIAFAEAYRALSSRWRCESERPIRRRLQPRRGELYSALLIESVVPELVVQADALTRLGHPQVVVVPTVDPTDESVLRVRVPPRATGRAARSLALDCVRMLNLGHLRERLGRAPPSLMRRVDECLAALLGLDTKDRGG